VDELNTTSEILGLTEARERLSDVRPVVEAIMHLVREQRDLQDELRERLEDESTGQLRSVILEKDTELRERIRELNLLGAVIKDPYTGLIDFYTWVQGDLAFLCWHHGEDTIEWWHGFNDGFAGRRHVSELEEGT